MSGGGSALERGTLIHQTLEAALAKRRERSLADPQVVVDVQEALRANPAVLWHVMSELIALVQVGVVKVAGPWREAASTELSHLQTDMREAGHHAFSEAPLSACRMKGRYDPTGDLVVGIVGIHRRGFSEVWSRVESALWWVVWPGDEVVKKFEQGTEPTRLEALQGRVDSKLRDTGWELVS